MMETLTAAGWDPGRRVDITEWLAEFALSGYFVSPLAIDLLATFGGLVLVSPAFEIMRSPAPVTINPMRALDGRPVFYERKIGESLTPFAEDKDSTVIYVSPSGAFYGHHESDFVCYGTTMPESFENVILSFKKVIPVTLEPAELQWSMQFEFGDMTLSALAAAGWHSNRRFDTAVWLTRLADAGYHVSPLAAELLESIGGLELVSTPDIERYRQPFRIKIDPTHALSGRPVTHEHDIGEPLTPLGVKHDGTLLYVSPTGAIHGDRGEGRWVCYGTTLPESLDRAVLVPYQAAP
ncbi:MAG: SUKH-3 domain-containing protein [Gemmataceae bacterium]